MWHYNLNKERWRSVVTGALLLLSVCVVPHMVSDYISEWKKIINDGEVCFTKGEKYRRWFEEATGEEVETLETTVEGEKI